MKPGPRFTKRGPFFDGEQYGRPNEHARADATDCHAGTAIDLEQRLSDVDALIAPSAPGFAPVGRTPGNPVFNAPWTAMQVPVVNVPVAGLPLPLGISVIGKRAFDRQVLDVAARLAGCL